MRQSRKLDHLKYSLSLADGPGANGFADITLVHNCLPNLKWDDIDISSSIAGIPINNPLIINAITGGAKDVTRVNGQIAEFACLTKTAMAVGSQYAALEDPEVKQSYKIVREKNPDGVIFANLGAYATPNQAKLAVDMIDAQAIQIHLNVAQELIMAEGDRDFSGYLTNIAHIAEQVSVPVIVKEVGCGIGKEQAHLLAEIGIKAIDIGGMGGTNFLAIEGARSQLSISQELLSWGIPTAISAIETMSVLPKELDMMVSGGVRTPLDVVKSLALGGNAAGIATPIIRMLYEKELEDAVSWFNHFLHEIKCYMLLSGAKNVNNVAKVPVVITGYSREWLLARGIDLTKYGIVEKHD
ncbi:type 2 isopentenyl-diphosphate Delta-isomerase [Pelosinus sp. sgz500959]|uniref:type 2 isopentenyl-diphosphate Delta-isomerase n=1 Tax=Pelosinus sp. sgz500959 TaxID=3242472 RepID=UPI003670A628